jgi:hypothetical protein
MTHKVSPASIERHGHTATVLQAAMNLKGMTCSAVAKHLGGTASASTVNNWVRAKHGIAETYRAKVAKILDLKEADLLPQGPPVKFGRKSKVTTKAKEHLPVVYQAPVPAKASSAKVSTGQAVVMIMPIEAAEAFMFKFLKGQ